MAIIITTLVCVLALVLIIFVSRYRYYDLDSWSGVLSKWADDNGVSRKRMPRYDEQSLLKIKELDLSNLELHSLPEEICNLTNLKKLNLSNNNLKALPKKIVDLKVELLDLRGNGELSLGAKQKAWAREIKEFFADSLVNLKD
ncbi:MAG: hypothetical protein LBQ18_02195 [Campylobacteraceae bacterium]|nr:hypothetical protein [Campylobacteraceae bacterium]